MKWPFSVVGLSAAGHETAQDLIEIEIAGGHTMGASTIPVARVKSKEQVRNHMMKLMACR